MSGPPIGWWKTPSHVRKVEESRRLAAEKAMRAAARRDWWRSVGLAVLFVVVLVGGFFGFCALVRCMTVTVSRNGAR